MGNRAVIALRSMPTVGVYVHWNGGPESVAAFCQATLDRGARTPKMDPTYHFARLIQTVADFFDRGASGEIISVGVGPMDMLDTDNGDNGVIWLNDHGQPEKRSQRVLDADQIKKRDAMIAQLMAVDAAREAVETS